MNTELRTLAILTLAKATGKTMLEVNEILQAMSEDVKNQREVV